MYSSTIRHQMYSAGANIQYHCGVKNADGEIESLCSILRGPWFSCIMICIQQDFPHTLWTAHHILNVNTNMTQILENHLQKIIKECLFDSQTEYRLQSI